MSINYISEPQRVNNDSGSSTHVGNTENLINVDINNQEIFNITSVVDNDAVDPILGLGSEFAHDHSRPIGMRLTTEIGGLNTSALLTTSSRPELYKSVNTTEKVISNRFSTSYRNGDFNYFTGKYTATPLSVEEDFWKANASDTYIDQNANSSRSNSGSMTWFGGGRPVNQNYNKKTG